MSTAYVRDGRQSHPLFQVWRGMIRRCYSPTAHGYENYGGRGIEVCERWRSCFWAFVDDIEKRPSLKHTLDRKKNNGHYEPGNVHWATREQQMRNTRLNRKLTCQGKTQTLKEWSIELGVAESTLFNRLRRGWSADRALTIEPYSKAANNTLMPAGGTALCEAVGIARETVHSRLRRGWDFQEAISRPVDHRRSPHA